jgi:hypothetical protein
MNIATTHEEARLLLTKALEAIPNLTYYGVGIPEQPKVYQEKGIEFIKEETAKLQAEMERHLDEIAICADWIKQVKPTKTVRSGSYSNGFKDRVEDWCRKKGSSRYISNGSFIAAAVGLGFRFTITGRNAAFNISEKAMRLIV